MADPTSTEKNNTKVDTGFSQVDVRRVARTLLTTKSREENEKKKKIFKKFKQRSQLQRQNSVLPYGKYAQYGKDLNYGKDAHYGKDRTLWQRCAL